MEKTLNEIQTKINELIQAEKTIENNCEIQIQKKVKNYNKWFKQYNIELEELMIEAEQTHPHKKTSSKITLPRTRRRRNMTKSNPIQERDYTKEIANKKEQLNNKFNALKNSVKNLTEQSNTEKKAFRDNNKEVLSKISRQLTNLKLSDYSKETQKKIRTMRTKVMMLQPINLQLIEYEIRFYNKQIECFQKQKIPSLGL